MEQLVEAVALGFVEGLTEFLPVSSTGHLLLIGDVLGFRSTGKAFEVMIQLGAILAILLVYFRRLLAIAVALPHDPDAKRFAVGVLVAFLPAAMIGAILHRFIKEVLFNPWIVCITLILGGLVFLLIDGTRLEARYRDATRFSLAMYAKIGLIQCLAMVPGVSRSGATIIGAMLLGADKRAAAEFSFFLALPTMAGAFAYELIKSYAILSFDDIALVAAGFISACVSALIVANGFLAWVSRHGFTPFAWWRIALGSAGLVWLGWAGQTTATLISY